MRYPTDEARKINFADLQSDLEEAREVFNLQNKNKKITSVIAKKNFFELILEVDEPPKSIGHELSPFSRFLSNNKEWYIYSRYPTKLFQFRSEPLLSQETMDQEKQEESEQNSLQTMFSDTIYVDENNKTIFINKKWIKYDIKFI